MTTFPPTDGDQSILSPETPIELFRIDLSRWNMGWENWTPSSAVPVRFGAIEYRPIAMKATGFDKTVSGTLPTPRLKIGNATRLATALLIATDDLDGAPVVRVTTYAKHLVGGSDPDPDRHHAPEIWYVDRVVAETAEEVELELAAVIDQRGKKLPGRQVTRGACLKRYRAWTGSGWDYSQVECPYAEDSCFDRTGSACAPALDVCGGRLSDCRLRFGSSPLPFGGFPGVGRTSTST